jgi:hypothetical protein
VALAALSPEFAASAGALVAPAAASTPAAAAITAAITAAIAAVPPAVVAAAALIVALLMALLAWITAVAVQLEFHERFTTNFDDGVVCIEYPAFALMLINLMTAGFAPTYLVPPIVTG